MILVIQRSRLGYIVSEYHSQLKAPTECTSSSLSLKLPEEPTATDNNKLCLSSYAALWSKERNSSPLAKEMIKSTACWLAANIILVFYDTLLYMNVRKGDTWATFPLLACSLACTGFDM